MTTSSPAGTPDGTTATRTVRDRVGSALAGRRDLRARIEALEAEVQENRRLNRRIAELTDLVVELLVPLEARDTARVEEILERYRAGL